MFIKQLRDFLVVGINVSLARVNVELEQSAHTIDSIKEDRYVKRSPPVVVDRVLIDAIQRTQHLARACVTFNRRVMQRRPTLFCEKNEISILKQQGHFPKKKKSSKN